jgi:hypothetical protein
MTTLLGCAAPRSTIQKLLAHLERDLQFCTPSPQRFNSLDVSITQNFMKYFGEHNDSHDHDPLGGCLSMED